MGELFGTDGVRGRAGEGPLAPAEERKLPRAAGGLLPEDPKAYAVKVPAAFRKIATVSKGPGAGRVLIGRDSRASGPDLERELVAGFAEAGVGAILAGVIPTPGVATLVRRWGCALGVVISASHNPAEDNGIKLVSPQGFKIPDAAEDAVETRHAAGAPPAKRKGAVPRDRSKRSGDYLDFLEGFGRPMKGLRIVADCAHGAASAYAGPLLKRLGAKAVLIHASPDGRNINAGCGALHPEKLAEAVRREKAHAGVAFDGDADRAIFVDETGEVRDGDHVLALCGAHLHERKALPGAVVVSTVMANLGLERALAKRGISLKRTKVGDKFVAEEMLASGAVLGGEQSGHVLFFDAAPAGDGMLTMLRVLGVLAERGEPFSKAASILAKYPQVLLNVKVARKPPLDQVEGVKRAVAAAEAELRDEGRILVRYSGTETLCRVMVEGADGALVDRAARAVADAVKKELS